MDTKQISEALVALHTALVAKTEEQPFLEVELKLSQRGNWYTDLSRDYNSGDYRLTTITSESPEACMAAAFAFVESMPDAHQLALNTWHKQLAEVIHNANRLEISNEVMGPLTQASRLMAKNLLTGPTTPRPEPVRIVEAGDCPF